MEEIIHQIIFVNGKEFDNARDALLELAFGHFPAKVKTEAVEKEFQTFSEAETFFRQLKGF